MSLPETMTVTAIEMQEYADEMHRRAVIHESHDNPLNDKEAKMLYAAAGALQGLANKLRKQNE